MAEHEDLEEWREWHKSLLRRPKAPSLKPRKQKPSIPGQKSLFGEGGPGEKLKEVTTPNP